MSQMTFSILDARRAIHSQPHGSFTYTLIPALCDDPETIDELRRAMRRFLAPDEDDDPLVRWSSGECDQPFDAGICIVDLPARLIVFHSTYCDVMRSGQITFDEAAEDSHWIPYLISDEWLVSDQVDGCQSLADERRRERQRNAPLDTRAVLYGEAVPLIVDECLAARGGSIDANGAWKPPAGWQWRELTERASRGTAPNISDAIAEIHARWLMTPRDDLRGQSPRAVLHAKRAEISRHVQDRELQWSNFGICPPGLWRKSIVYRLGGYGTHEIIVYYELLRHLLHECWDLLGRDDAAITRAAAIERLRMTQQEWLHTPNHEEYLGKSPWYVIERERQRLPLGATPKQTIIDCDCPLCQMMADSGPSFWHLDGCNMDDDFPFALFETTREKWDEKRREWSEWERDRAESREADEAEELVLRDDALNDESPSGLWQRSYVRSFRSESPTLTLFGLGCHLAELIDDLRGSHGGRTPASRGTIEQAARGSIAACSTDPAETDAQYWIDTLNRDFMNLREAVSAPGSTLVEPVAAKFAEHLLAVAESRADLRAKCLDLDRQLFEFARRLTGKSTAGDVPL